MRRNAGFKPPSGEPSINIGELPLHEQEARSPKREARQRGGQNMAGPMRTVTMQARRPTWAALVLLLVGAPTAAFAQANCRNTAPFEPWLATFKKDAAAQGVSQATIAAAS